MDDLFKYLERYKDKTIEEVISIEKTLYENKINDLKSKEILKQNLIKDVLNQKYFKINFNGRSITYVEIKSINPIISIAIETFIDDDRFSIEYNSSRKLNDLWFIEPNNSYTKIDKISEEQYLLMLELYNNTKNIVKNSRL